MQKEVVQVYKPGTEVVTKIGGVRALITEARITQSGRRYLLCWFSEGKAESCVVDECEIESVNGKLKIGYK